MSSFGPVTLSRKAVSRACMASRLSGSAAETALGFGSFFQLAGDELAGGGGGRREEDGGEGLAAGLPFAP
jgi:hypothetical protein